MRLNSITFDFLKTRKPFFQSSFLSSIIAMVVAWMVVSTSCNTNHCNDSMYAPLNVVFYSEIDTAQPVAPLFLRMKGVGADSVIYASGLNNVNLMLNADTKTTEYVFSMTFAGSPMMALVADSTQPFLPIWRPNILGVLELDSIPSSYFSLDQTQHYQITQGDNYTFFFGDETPQVYLAKENPIVYFQQATSDTLRIDYDTSLDFVSAECGCMNVFTIKDAEFLHKGVAEAMVTNKKINSDSYAKHISLYLENY